MCFIIVVQSFRLSPVIDGLVVAGEID